MEIDRIEYGSIFHKIAEIYDLMEDRQIVNI